MAKGRDVFLGDVLRESNKIPGTVELSFPYDRDVQSNVQVIDIRDRYQPHTLFADCSFENAAEKEPGSARGGPASGWTFSWYTVRCLIQVTNEIKGKRLLAVLHGNPVGSSQYFGI